MVIRKWRNNADPRREAIACNGDPRSAFAEMSVEIAHRVTVYRFKF